MRVAKEFINDDSKKFTLTQDVNMVDLPDSLTDKAIGHAAQQAAAIQDQQFRTLLERNGIPWQHGNIEVIQKYLEERGYRVIQEKEGNHWDMSDSITKMYLVKIIDMQQFKITFNVKMGDK